MQLKYNLGNYKILLQILHQQLLLQKHLLQLPHSEMLTTSAAWASSMSPVVFLCFLKHANISC